MADTVTLTLTDFLLARIAEDEAAARDVRQHERLDSGRDTSRLKSAPRGGYVTVAASSGRILAECKAKTQIVAQYMGSRDALASTQARVKSGELVGAHAIAQPMFGEAMVLAHSDALKVLAAVYADHPDYREEWRP